MCGIFGYVGKQDEPAQKILEGLKTLEYRGYDSWGIAVVHDGKIAVDRHVGKIGDASTNLPSSSIGIGHTRWATHGGVTEANAHPHLDSKGRIAVVHNGIIENYHLLRAELKDKGHTFKSETDTEVIAHLIAEELEKKDDLKEAVRITFKKLVGSNALAVLDLKSNQLAVCRDGSPIAIGVGEGINYIGSDVTPFLKYTKSVIFLDDGEGVILDSDKVTVFNIETGEAMNRAPETLDWEAEDVKKDGYPHYLIKEIMEQKRTIAATASLNIEEMNKLAAMIGDGYKVVISACGTAAYCGLAAQYFFASQNIQTSMYGSYEFLPFSKFIDKKTIFIAISQSGETADTLIAAKAAKKQGAHLVAVVNARGSTLERLSDTAISVGAGPEIAVISTKAFTAQLSSLYLLASAAGGKLKEGQENIKNLGSILQTWITKDLENSILEVSKSLVEKEHIYLIGKHLGYPAAMEVALKIKEISYIHSEAFAAGELKHGVIALIEEGTPCIALVSDDEVKDEVLSSTAELKARGGKIIGIAPANSPEFDIHIPIPDTKELTIIPQVVVGQLLAYYLAIGRGTDVDKPRNLAKSVTVK